MMSNDDNEKECACPFPSTVFTIVCLTIAPFFIEEPPKKKRVVDDDDDEEDDYELNAIKQKQQQHHQQSHNRFPYGTNTRLKKTL